METRKHSKGFTLVELMVAVSLSSMVAMAIFWTYTNQQKISRRQEAVVDMQQNLRGGVFLVGQELRMAGYDPVGTAGAAITAANSTNIAFSKDITDPLGTANDGDGALGGPNESIILNFTGTAITRDSGGGAQPFIDNVDFFELAYTLDDGTVTLNPPVAFLDEIRTIQISILVRSPIQEPDLLNNLPYTTAFGTPVPGPLPANRFNDNVRRRMINTTIQCRNASI